MADEMVQVVFYPDYIDYHGAHYIDSVVSFSRGFVEVTSYTVLGKEETFHVHLEIDDIIKIESQWSAQCEAGIINIYFISKGAAQNASDVKELKFPAVDANWCKKQEAIESLNLRYKALWNVLLDTRMENSSALPDRRVMLAKSYFPNFNKSFGEVIYPKGDPDAVSISKRDIDLLRPETFVNDTIIDFYIKYLKTRQNVEGRMKFHFFNSFFFRKLADMDKDPSSAFDGKAAFQRVRKWTRKVNLLEKDFIFIPVNYNYHWSLIVICYFGEVASYEDAEGGKSARVPCILHMDSIKGSHAGLKDLMQSYLWEEWKERHKESREDLYSKFRNLKFIPLELPQQQNSYDCGLFLLHYVELFLEEVPTDFSIYKITTSSKFLQADWFPHGEASMKRVHIERLIEDLLDPHAEDCSPSDRSHMHCSPGGPKTTFENENVGVPEKSGRLRCADWDSQCSYSREAEMSLLQDPSLRSRECIRSTGLVLKELFESGSAAESFDAAPWGSLEHGGLNQFRRLPRTEEEVGIGECFVPTEFVGNPFPQLDRVTTGSSAIPYTAAECRPDPSHQASLEDGSSPLAPGRGSDDDLSGLKADGKIQSLGACSLEVELDKPRHTASENLKYSTVYFPLASGETLLTGESLAVGNDSLKNSPGVYSDKHDFEDNHLSSTHYLTDLPRFSSDDKLDIMEPAITRSTVNSDNQEYLCAEEALVSSHLGNGLLLETEPLSESGDDHPAKKMRIGPLDGEEPGRNLCKDLHL